MSTTPARRQTMILSFALVTMPGLPALAGVTVTAIRSLTVQPSGPRQGEAGSRYVNVEGSKNDKYASFGVLVFELPKGGDQAGDARAVSLRLFRSVARFSKDGGAKFFLAEPADGGGDRSPSLKFEAGSPGGFAKGAFKALHPLGSGVFKKVGTRYAGAFELRPDEAGRHPLLDRLKAGGTILVVVVPEDEEVAATYFGVGVGPEDNRPRLSIGGEQAK